MLLGDGQYSWVSSTGDFNVITAVACNRASRRCHIIIIICRVHLVFACLCVFAVHPKQSDEIRRNIRGHSAAPNLASETPSGTLQRARSGGRSKTPQHLAVDMPPMEDDPDQDYYPKPKFRSRHRNSNQGKSRGDRIIILEDDDGDVTVSYAWLCVTWSLW